MTDRATTTRHQGEHRMTTPKNIAAKTKAMAAAFMHHMEPMWGKVKSPTGVAISSGWAALVLYGIVAK
jgi:hypothetical protein